MDLKRIITSAVLCAFGTLKLLSQTPPSNDSYTNPIVLYGSSLTITGNLAGSTVEAQEPASPRASSPSDGSIWWRWSTPAPINVIISLSRDFTSLSGSNTWLEVFTGPTNFPFQLRVDYDSFDVPIGRAVKFAAVTGTNYLIRARGGWRAPLTLKLIATNLPVIFTQPANCTASPYSSAAFSVFARGIPQPAYQWLFNGSPMLGQTAQTLLLHNLQTNRAGNYSVIVSNSGGAILSSSAVLTVLNTNPVPRLGALPPGNFGPVPFTLTGEPGRWYAFHATGDFGFWVDLGFGLSTNATTTFNVARFWGDNQFIGATLNYYTDVCKAQLIAMRSAVDFFALDQKHPMNDVYNINNLSPYFASNTAPTCAQNGAYSAGVNFTNPPTCSLENYCGHRLGN